MGRVRRPLFSAAHPGLGAVAVMSRHGDPGLLVLEVDVAHSHDRHRDTLENTCRFNRVFEEMVHRYSDQWIWRHKQWRNRPPARH